MKWEDPIVAEVRKVREELAARFDFDLAAIFTDIRTRQKQVGSRLVRMNEESATPSEQEDKSISSASRQ